VLALEELKANLRAAEDETRYRLYFEALLGREAGAPAEGFVVVGGSAIEAYTTGRYASGDIDIVATHGERVEEVLRAWGFRRHGRVWTNEELRLVVDLVKLPYTGNLEKTRVLLTSFGPVRLAAVEDLLVKRLSSAKHWKQPGDLEQAKLLALQFFDSIDWAYVERFAREHDVGEIADALREAAKGVTRGRPPTKG
jgi:hypothetical protein